jgi:two-component system, LytTR family, sensor kinase
MDTILYDVCVLVTAAFALTLVPGFRQTEQSLLSRRDRGSALLVFLVLGLVEEATVSHAGWINERIVAACAGGLVAGPLVGLAVAAFITWLAVVHDGLPLVSIAIPMLSGGLAGGLLCRWRPGLARHPLTGFFLTLAVSWIRLVLLFFASRVHQPQHGIDDIGIAPVLQGLGTALILAIVQQVRERDEKTRAAAVAEARALQARMNPHFLFNALNALAALSVVKPREVPPAAGKLRRFLRASFDQQDQLFVSVEEELAVVRAYLDIESLRLGNRLKIEEVIDPSALAASIPPFSFQPLVENAVQHGLFSSPRAGSLKLAVRSTGAFLEMSVSDDGEGVPPDEVEKVFFPNRPKVHALALLRRRLQGLFGSSFHLEVHSEIGEGTTVTMQIPLRKQLAVGLVSQGAVTRHLPDLAHY